MMNDYAMNDGDGVGVRLAYRVVEQAVAVFVVGGVDKNCVGAMAMAVGYGYGGVVGGVDVVGYVDAVVELLGDVECVVRGVGDDLRTTEQVAG